MRLFAVAAGDSPARVARLLGLVSSDEEVTAPPAAEMRAGSGGLAAIWKIACPHQPIAPHNVARHISQGQRAVNSRHHRGLGFIAIWILDLISLERGWTPLQESKQGPSIFQRLSRLDPSAAVHDVVHDEIDDAHDTVLIVMLASTTRYSNAQLALPDFEQPHRPNDTIASGKSVYGEIDNPGVRHLQLESKFLVRGRESVSLRSIERCLTAPLESCLPAAAVVDLIRFPNGLVPGQICLAPLLAGSGHRAMQRNRLVTCCPGQRLGSHRRIRLDAQ